MGEKVIVATQDVRYPAEALDQMCALLEVQEVVEPQDYLEPRQWWGTLEAGRMLVARGLQRQPGHGATFGFRRTALRGLRGLASSSSHADPARRLAASGAEVYAATEVFVRREAGGFREWLERRPRLAKQDFASPVKAAFFFSLLPLLALVAMLGGLPLAGGIASAIALGAIGLAVRGRAGARAFFPWPACLMAPLWVIERSVSVYWALLRELRGVDSTATGVAMPDRARGEKVASGR